uniref:Uncharacterized protein n=1 Tax=Panagrolaimus sp. JU765 TaxID=591449 RepID=A0AC34RQX1_9BILA
MWREFVVLIFGLLTSLKVPFTKQEDDLKTGYTPLGARSYSEVAMYEEFNAKHGNDQIGLGIFIRPNDEKTLTRVEHLNATIDLLDFIGNNFTINGLNFYEFCTDFCEFNEPVRQFRNGLVIQTSPEYTIPEELFDSRMNLTFPFMSIFGRQLDLSPLFFGVKKFDNPENQRLTNSTTNIENLPLIVLQLKADKPQNISKEDVSKWEREIEHYVHQ